MRQTSGSSAQRKHQGGNAVQWGLLVLLAGLGGSACQPPTNSISAFPGFTPLPFLPKLTYEVAASPDGTKVAYSDYEGLFVADLTTQTPKKLADSEGPISHVGWTGDGKFVTFLPSHLPPVTDPGEPKRSPAPSWPAGRLQLVNVESGTTKSTSIDGTALHAISGSPDGHYLALLEDSGISLYNVASDAETRVSSKPSFTGAVWSPDSQHLAFRGPMTPDGPSDELLLTTTTASAAATAVEADLNDRHFGINAECYPAEEKAFWAADSQSITAVQAIDGQHVALRTFDLTGKKLSERTLDMTDPEEPTSWLDCYHASPSGRFLIAMRSGKALMGQMTPDGWSARALVAVNMTTGAVKAIAPPIELVCWLGNSDRLILSESPGQYYLCTPSWP
ncbi:MAG TPA: hypothetical protein V6D47_08070 [Oscillatoriaceae cyanobacterium]